MAELKPGTWVLICDGEKALFLRNDGDAEAPNLNVVRIDTQNNPKDSEQSPDSPGRVQGGSHGQRSALDDTDWHELAKGRFASDLAERLYKLAHRGAFEHIVIVAAARTLGALRAELHPEVASKVIAEFDKVLTNHPLDKVEEMVKAQLADM